MRLLMPVRPSSTQQEQQPMQAGQQPALVQLQS
jgi:hypothetical protein